MIALWFNVCNRLSIQDIQHFTKHRHIVAAMLPSDLCRLNSELTIILRIVIIVIKTAANVNDPI
jgi:hypothetical protein